MNCLTVRILWKTEKGEPKVIHPLVANEFPSGGFKMSQRRNNWNF